MTHKVILVAPGDRQLADTLTAAGGDVTTAASLEALHLSGSAARMLVVDIRDQSSVPAAVSSIRRISPSLGIVLIASKPDPAMMLEAIRTGVNELLTEPVNVEDVRAALDRMASRSASQSTKAGKTYAFLGAKGGVGTTTVAVNVATALVTSQAPGAVLLIDLHPAHGDAALFLGAEPRFSVIDALENTHRLDAAYFKGLVEHTKAGVDLLASSDRLLVTPVDSQRVRRCSSSSRGPTTTSSSTPRGPTRPCSTPRKRLDHRHRREPGTVDRPRRGAHGRDAAAALRQERVKSW